MFSEELEKISWEETTDAIYSKTESDVLRALGKSHCDVNDFMALVSPAAEKYIEPMARLSRKYTEERFGKTISMFVPLYLTNSCTNSCVYCGFHISNPMARTILTPEEMINEYKAIKKLQQNIFLLCCSLILVHTGNMPSDTVRQVLQLFQYITVYRKYHITFAVYIYHADTHIFIRPFIVQIFTPAYNIIIFY